MILSDHFTSLNIKLTSIFRLLSSQYNLSYPQYCILMKIDASSNPMSDLAKILGLDKSTLTRNINVLINRKLVDKYQDQTDLRVYRVILTSKGEKIKTNLYNDLDNFTSALLNSLDSNVQDEIYLLDKLIQKLDSYEISK